MQAQFVLLIRWWNLLGSINVTKLLLGVFRATVEEVEFARAYVVIFGVFFFVVVVVGGVKKIAEGCVGCNGWKAWGRRCTVDVMMMTMCSANIICISTG